MTISRRNFLQNSAFTAAGLFVVPLLAKAANPEPDKPNIVLFVSDDMGWRDVGCYGSPNVKTPNLDRLASEGIRFTNAYTASPVCGPTRGQLYSGMYPVNSHSYNNHPGHYVHEGVKTLPTCMKALGYRVGIVGKVDAGPVESYPFEPIPFSHKNLLGKPVRDFITRDPNEPFCLVVASTQPHVGWNSKLPRMNPADVVVPGHLADTPETRKTLTDYYADVAALDIEVGDTLKMLEETGNSNVLFLWTSEQGAEVPFGKGTLFDNGMKLAVIARWPGHVKPNSVCDEIIQHIDFLPTIVDAAGGPKQPNWDGKSFISLLEGKSVQNHPFAYGCFEDKRAVRTKQYKYIRNLDPDSLDGRTVSPFRKGQIPDYAQHVQSWIPLAESDPEVAKKLNWFKKRAPEELFDIEKDPFEVNNLASSPEYADILADMRSQCDAIMAEQGDKGLDTANEIARWNSEQHAAGKGFINNSNGKIKYPNRRNAKRNDSE